MKLQIACDTTDLDNAVTTARAIAPYCDIIEIGTVLLYAPRHQSCTTVSQSCWQQNAAR